MIKMLNVSFVFGERKIEYISNGDEELIKVDIDDDDYKRKLFELKREVNGWSRIRGGVTEFIPLYIGESIWEVFNRIHYDGRMRDLVIQLKEEVERRFK
jgi:hypothetical protein